MDAQRADSGRGSPSPGKVPRLSRQGHLRDGGAWKRILRKARSGDVTTEGGVVKLQARNERAFTNYPVNNLGSGAGCGRASNCCMHIVAISSIRPIRLSVFRQTEINAANPSTLIIIALDRGDSHQMKPYTNLVLKITSLPRPQTERQSSENNRAPKVRTFYQRPRCKANKFEVLPLAQKRRSTAFRSHGAGKLRVQLLQEWITAL